MAASHIRSNSLPSSTHPLSNTVEEQLQWLRSCEATSSSSSMCQKLGGLKDLYDSVDDWLQLSLAQQVLSNQNNRQCIKDLLDGSLQTLDVCGTLLEVLTQMKDSIRELESSLRRRTASANELDAYIASRKKMKKVICRMMENLKKIEKKQNILKKEDKVEQEAALSMLREVGQISLSVFESLLSFLCKPKTRSNGWSLVSKVVSSKRISREALTTASEVEELDTELLVLKSGKDKNILIHNVQKHVQALESSIWEIEEVSECAFRSLLKTRVALLNNLNH
ncbi:uncharacterized protein LOC116215329 [Punica granatum]|uniref:Uncharacterized protein n=2 Tax=Punica granatum TaxID=22663 RepID=A0A2I0JFV3_PUNGR|nr:uncharacterized protein LOC116215329 [Punica granatum]PKI55152.1 hypothetical protein CRG98_024443 [Punica granatum]